MAHSTAAMLQSIHGAHFTESAATAASKGRPQPAAQGHCRPVLDKCLVPVRVKMIGKGVALEGAAILDSGRADPGQDTSSSPHSPHDQDAGVLMTASAAADMPLAGVRGDNKMASHQMTQQHQAAAQSEAGESAADEHEQHSPKRVKFADTVFQGSPNVADAAPSDSDMIVISNDASSAEKPAEADNMQVSMTKVTSNHSAYDQETQQCHQDIGDDVRSGEGERIDRQQTVIGYVTTEAPRGVTCGAGPRALCSFDALRGLYSQQVAARVIRNSSHGIVVHVKNRCSTECRRAALYCVDDVSWQGMLRHHL